MEIIEKRENTKSNILIELSHDDNTASSSSEVNDLSEKNFTNSNCI
jgi:hypothetical protein